MDTNGEPRSVSKVAAAGAVALGPAAGSYGVANAASGPDAAASSSSGSSGDAATSVSTTPDPGSPWGGQRRDETLLTGDTAANVEAAASGRFANATTVRVETDADGNAASEVHMVKADGTPVTVYVDERFEVVSVESR
jgi:hypothetical protein